MGAYLSEPITTKEIETEENELMAVVAVSMQGWRVSQEDAHNAILKYDKNSSLFAVYDGHGGHEVAKYCALKLPDFIKLNEDYLAGKIDKALIDSFVEFDRTLTDRKVVAELKKIAGAENEEEEHDPAEVDHLYQEATMPIEEVVAKYGRSEDVEGEKNEDGASSAPKKLLIHPAVAELSKKGRKPISPFLRAKTVSRIQSDTNEEGSGNSSSDVKAESEEEKTEAPAEEQSAEADSGKQTEVKVNGDSESSTNGHSDSDKKDSNGDAKPAPAVNGESVESEEKVVSVKGKGKGKGKSSMASTAVVSSDAANNDKDGDAPKVVPKKKKTFKSAQELYHHVLAADSDGDDEDLDDDDDENFGESEDGEDSDDYEDMDSGEEEDEGDEEEDSEDEDEDDDDDDEMNGEVIGGNFNEEPGNDSGCTAVVALIRGTKLIVANAGDSRCIVCRDGKAIEMSADHKPEDQPEMERIEKAGGRVTPDGRVNGGLNLSRALGDHAYKTNKELPLQEQMISPVPDIRTHELDPKLDSFVFLACDGIWNSLSSQEVADFITERLQKADKHTPEELKTICVELFEHCLAPDTMGDGTGCDNMTAVLVKLKPEFGKESVEAGGSSKRQATDETEDEPQQSKKLKLDSEEKNEEVGASE